MGEIKKVMGYGRDGEFYPGDIVEAELIREIGCGFWWVKFPDEQPKKGKPVLRVRMVVA